MRAHLKFESSSPRFWSQTIIGQQSWTNARQDVAWHRYTRSYLSIAFCRRVASEDQYYSPEFYPDVSSRANRLGLGSLFFSEENKPPLSFRAVNYTLAGWMKRPLPGGRDPPPKSLIQNILRVAAWKQRATHRYIPNLTSLRRSNKSVIF